MRQFLLIIIVAAFAASSALGDDFRFPLDTINQTLNYISIDTSDVGFRTDWVDLDSFRLTIVDSLMRRPLAMPTHLKSMADSLLDSTIAIKSKDWLLQEQLGWFRDGSVKFTHFSPHIENYFRTFTTDHSSCDSLADYIAFTMHTLAAAAFVGPSWKEFILDEGGFLTDTFLVFLREEEKDVHRPLEELDSLQQYHDSVAKRFKELSETYDLRDIFRPSSDVILGYERLATWLGKTSEILSRSIECDTLINLKTFDTPLGRFAIGGVHSDRYEGSYNLIIDFGGDDEYILSNPTPHRNQIIIDLSGNDRYIAKSDHVMGAGFFSTGILDDWEGDDIYIAGKYSQGCGIFGTGILIDREGDDFYRGDIACQAASSFGVGLLLDYEGRDTYQAALYSQGFGFIMGASALVDRSGNDNYTAGWKYGDILRYEDHYVSLSQGFGYGLRPYFSGGIGYLIDGGGNDQYSADIFGQGASYWFGLGGLIDYGGNDNYIAYQYAQGAATHMCIAALVDISGDDLYSSKGVSQGCGHDIAFGLLLDCNGNDQYSATDLSQAAGSANGVGMLIDFRGNDGHIARVDFNTHGYGNPRREYGSIGLFLDLEGKDDYRGYGKNSSYWVTPSKWGIGADLGSEEKK